MATMQREIRRGPTAAVLRFAEQLVAEPGIRHGSLRLVTGDRHAQDLPSGQRRQQRPARAAAAEKR